MSVIEEDHPCGPCLQRDLVGEACCCCVPTGAKRLPRAARRRLVLGIPETHEVGPVEELPHPLRVSL